MWCRFIAHGRCASSLFIRSIFRILGFKSASSRFSEIAWISDSWTLSSSMQECLDTACKEKYKIHHILRYWVGMALLSKHLNIDLRMQQHQRRQLPSVQTVSLIWQITALHLIKCHSDLLPLLLSSFLHPCRPIISNSCCHSSRKCYKNMDFPSRVALYFQDFWWNFWVSFWVSNKQLISKKYFKAWCLFRIIEQNRLDWY